MPDAWLDQLEALLAASDVADAVVTVAFAAGRNVSIEPEEVHAATRRALLVLAAGGDLQRGLDLEGPAVERLAGELDSPGRRDALERGLRGLASSGRPHVAETANALLDAPERAWRAYACATLAESLSA